VQPLAGLVQLSVIVFSASHLARPARSGFSVIQNVLIA
jgi:hypothetical protein